MCVRWANLGWAFFTEIRRIIFHPHFPPLTLVAPLKAATRDDVEIVDTTTRIQIVEEVGDMEGRGAGAKGERDGIWKGGVDEYDKREQ